MKIKVFVFVTISLCGFNLLGMEHRASGSTSPVDEVRESLKKSPSTEYLLDRQSGNGEGSDQKNTISIDRVLEGTGQKNTISIEMILRDFLDLNITPNIDDSVKLLITANANVRTLVTDKKTEFIFVRFIIAVYLYEKKNRRFSSAENRFKLVTDIIESIGQEKIRIHGNLIQTLLIDPVQKKSGLKRKNKSNFTFFYKGYKESWLNDNSQRPINEKYFNDLSEMIDAWQKGHSCDNAAYDGDSDGDFDGDDCC